MPSRSRASGRCGTPLAAVARRSPCAEKDPTGRGVEECRWAGTSRSAGSRTILRCGGRHLEGGDEGGDDLAPVSEDANVGAFEDRGVWVVVDPMCMAMIVSVSWQACKKGSQWPEWIDGSLRNVGISEKQTTRKP